MFNREIAIAATEISTGGLGSYLINVAEGLISRGWNVHLLTTHERGDLYETVQKSVTCHDLSGISLSRKKVIAATDLLNAISSDILLINNCSLIHYCLPLLTSYIKPVVVIHSDDPRFYETATMFGSRIFRWIAPTKGVAKRCLTYLPDGLSKRLRTIPHGINANFFHPLQKRDKNHTGILCFVGYIAENKGVDLLPDIMVRITAEHHSARLNIIGSGPMAETLKRSFGERNILFNCTFTGPLSSNEVADILRVSDIFLLPTRIEGFGLSIAEAMMSGTVPVVTRLEGITDDFINDGINGFLVAQDDVIGFSDVVINLLNDDLKLESISEAARKAALERYSLDRMLDDYENLFGEEDDREHLPRRGTVGWFSESFCEFLKKELNGKQPIRKILGSVKYLFPKTKTV